MLENSAKSRPKPASRRQLTISNPIIPNAPWRLCQQKPTGRSV